VPATRVSGSRRVGFAAFTLVASGLLGLVALEGGLRVYDGLNRARALRELPPVEERVMVPSPDPELIFEFRPNVDQDGFTTNSFGMPDREIPVHKPAGRFRIAFVGDSVSASWGYVPRGEIYLNRVARELDRAPGGPRVESLNFAVNGYSILQGVQVARTKVPPFEPDLVVAQLSLNDPYPSDTVYAQVAPQGPLRLLNLVRRVLWPDRHMAWYSVLRNYDEEGWQNVRKGMQGYAALARQGPPLIAVLFPYATRRAYDEWGFDALHARYAEEARRAGLPLLDLFAAFDASGQITDVPQLHPTSEGHAVAARALVDELRSRRLVPGAAAERGEALPAGQASESP